MSLGLEKISLRNVGQGLAKEGWQPGQDPPVDLPARVKGLGVKGLQDGQEWFQVRLVQHDGSSEAVYEGDAKEAISWTREWLRNPLGLTIAIVPIGQSQQEAA